MLNLQIQELPTQVPLLLVRGAVLLPKTGFSFPVSNPLYAQMLRAALQKSPYLGLIQPSIASDTPIDFDDTPLFSTGSLTRVTEMTETHDNGLVLILESICRFRVMAHKPHAHHAYPMAHVDYQPFGDDLNQNADLSIHTDELLTIFKPYFMQQDISMEWENLFHQSQQEIVGTLLLACPFTPLEKQAILEQRSPQEQLDSMISLVKMDTVVSYEAGHVIH